jgi:hypothetical protein
MRTHELNLEFVLKLGVWLFLLPISKKPEFSFLQILKEPRLGIKVLKLGCEKVKKFIERIHVVVRTDLDLDMVRYARNISSGTRQTSQIISLSEILSKHLFPVLR